MQLLDLLRTITSNLNRMRVRVILTAFGVVIGTAAVLVLVSLGAGLQRSATQEIGGIADLTSIRVFSPEMGMPVAPGEERRRDDQPQGLTLEMLQDLESLPGVVAVTPVESINAPVVLKYKRLEAYANIVGVEPAAFESLGYELASGSSRLLKNQAVAGAQIARGFYDPRQMEQGMVFGPGGPMQNRPPVELQDAPLVLEVQRFSDNGTATTREMRLQVTGVLEESGEADYNLYLPLRDVDALNEWYTGNQIDRQKQGYQQAIVKVAAPRDVADVQAALREQNLNSYSMQDALQSINTFFLVLQLILGGIGAIALLVAALGIANTLSMAIYERTREIGLMKAIGARNRDVMSIFLGEAGAIGFLGGAVGVLLGWAVSSVIGLFAQSALAQQGGLFGDGNTGSIVYTPLWLFPFGIFFATVVGLVSGIYPALRAATLDPLKALKYE